MHLATVFPSRLDRLSPVPQKISLHQWHLGTMLGCNNEVQARLRELADNIQAGNSKIKSQRGGAVDVYVSNRVKWPHEFVLSGHSKERVTYNQLSPVQ